MRPFPLVLLLAALAACSRPRPSPEYEEARRRYRALLVARPADGWEQPEMAAVLELLASVPARSADAEAAADLRRQILEEQKALAEERARRERLVETAGPGAGPPFGSSAPAAAEAEEAAAPAPEPRAPSQLAQGTSLEEFRKARGDCFVPRAVARIGQEGGGSVAGEAWALRDDDACRAANPTEVGRVVLFSGGKLVSVRDQAEAKEQSVTEKIQGVRLPDGTVGYVGPDGKPRPLPPGAQVKWTPPPAPAQAKAPAGPAAPGSSPPAPPGPAPAAPGPQPAPPAGGAR